MRVVREHCFPLIKFMDEIHNRVIRGDLNQKVPGDQTSNAS